MHTNMKTAARTLALLLALAGSTSAQIDGLLRKSPKSAVLQTIGLTEVRIDYHRPGVKGRKIWGDVVPYDLVWRAGANDNTLISFSTDAHIGGQPLPAGTYGLHMIPGKDSWTVAFSKDVKNWGSYNYKPEKDALRVQVKPKKAPFCEWMRFGFDDLTRDGATLFLHWAELYVPVKIEVDTPGLLLSKIEAELERAPSAEAYLEAARFCMENSFRLDDGLGWVDRALAEKEAFDAVAVRAGLLHLLGEEEEFESTLQVAFAIGNANEVPMMGVRLQNQGHNDLALRFLEKGVEMAPENWWAWNSLGDARKAKGEGELAVAAYMKAIDLAPGDDQIKVIEASLIEAEDL